MLDRVQGINVQESEEFFFLGGGGCRMHQSNASSSPEEARLCWDTLTSNLYLGEGVICAEETRAMPLICSICCV